MSFKGVVFLKYMPSSGIAGSCGRFIPIFFFLRTLHIVFHSGCISYQFPVFNGAVRFPFSTLSPAFIVCRLFDDGHSDWNKVVHRFSCYILSFFFGVIFNTLGVSHVILCFSDYSFLIIIHSLSTKL